jgi:cell division protein FtsB
VSIPLPLKPKHSWRRWFSTGRWVVLVGIVILVGLGIALSREVMRKTRVRNEIAKLDSDIYSLERRNEELRGLIDYFDSDAYKEREARAKLNVQRPGEKVIEVVQPEVRAEVAATVSSHTNETNLARWWRYFFAPRD